MIMEIFLLVINYNYKLSYIVDVLIGATDVFKEGSWVHLSSWREITFSDWGPDQPDNHFSSSEHCLVLKSGHGFGYQWNDVVCNFEAYVVCEQKLG